MDILNENCYMIANVDLSQVNNESMDPGFPI